jgi:FKBP-type peptidyl-prolyl cis-trans isomerase
MSAPLAMSALKSMTLTPGTGATVAGGQIAVVQYTGWLYEANATDNKGKQFDSSRSAGQPFKFPLNTGSVIKGWDQGVVGMKVGETRRLVIPPNLAYGDAGAGGVIPPGATLVFDVELIGIE